MLKRNHLGSFRILVANNYILMNTFITKLISTATVQVGYMGDILSRHCKSVCTIYQFCYWFKTEKFRQFIQLQSLKNSLVTIQNFPAKCQWSEQVFIQSLITFFTPISPGFISQWKLWEFWKHSIQILKSNSSLSVLALASDRTNQMSKTYNDLDAILQLLQEVCSKAM